MRRKIRVQRLNSNLINRRLNFRFYFNADNKSCVQYPEGEMYMVDEADKIMFFNANFCAFAVFVFLAVIILAIQKDLICDILRGKISPLNDAMNAEAEGGSYPEDTTIYNRIIQEE